MPKSIQPFIVAFVILAASATAPSARGQCQEWDPTIATGSAVDAPIEVIATLDGGTGITLIAGGHFTTIGGMAAPGIAMRFSNGWLPLGQVLAQGPVEAVYALASFDSGAGPELYAGGDFVPPPPLPSHVARWDGTSWNAVGETLSDPSGASTVYALAPGHLGGAPGLFVGGSFTMAGNFGMNHVARWDGGSWNALGFGVDGTVVALQMFDDGSGPALYVGGVFMNAGGLPARGIAKWDGVDWSPVGGSVDGDVKSFAVFDDGNGAALYAGGSFVHAGGVQVNHVARWDGTHWTALAGGVTHPNMTPTVETLKVADDGTGPALFAGGLFESAGGTAAAHIARWDGTAWSALGEGTDGTVKRLTAWNDGAAGGPDLYATGTFTTAGGLAANPIAEWRGCDAGTPFCVADGVDIHCPCGNDGQHGHGCENSATTGGAFLHATRDLGLDSAVLTASGETPTALSIFLQGSVQIDGALAFGDGRRCTGGMMKRLYVKHAVGGVVTAPEAGDPSIPDRSTSLGDPIPTGATRAYQVYYRDPSPTFCPSPPGGTFNISNGILLTW
ncbi:MAG TPA: hypothetical protein VGR31_03365 [Planctomycetota bacterium]|jgi:hypothetical protein|nr:hypothetical protein [Planctomycetota bacterium]